VSNIDEPPGANSGALWGAELWATPGCQQLKRSLLSTPRTAAGPLSGTALKANGVPFRPHRPPSNLALILHPHRHRRVTPARLSVRIKELSRTSSSPTSSVSRSADAFPVTKQSPNALSTRCWTELAYNSAALIVASTPLEVMARNHLLSIPWDSVPVKGFATKFHIRQATEFSESRQNVG
jgi:hypothetical protein